MAKKIAAIWAEDKNGLIGTEGRLPWHLPAELQHFKEVTVGQVVLMGRKTFDGMNQRALPERTTLVLTRDTSVAIGNVTILNSREEALNWYKAQERDLYIIGGSEIFKLFSEDITEFYQTVVDGEFIGDTYMPPLLDIADAEKISSFMHSADEKNPYAFTINHYVRKLNV